MGSPKLIDLPRAPEAIELRHLRAFVDVAEAVQSTRSVAGRLDAEVVRLAQPLADTLATGGLDAFREAYEAMNAQLPSPTEIQARAVNAGGTPALVYGAPGADVPTVLYLHGGGYVVGS